MVWGVNVQYLAFVWLTQDFIGWLRRSSCFCIDGGAIVQSWEKEKKTLDVIDVIFVHLIYFPFLPPYSSSFALNFTPEFIFHQCLF